jgi:hypothetical protein
MIGSTLQSGPVTKPSGATPAFFCPAAGISAREGKRQYARLRDAVRTQTGREPRARRIFSVDCRLAGRDCRVEVGQPHPVRNEAILAIFDLGGPEPYAICTDAGGPALRLDKRVYLVTEFS